MISHQEKWDRRWLELANVIGGWSKDPSTKVGAVIVDGRNRLVSVGYNGLPQGIVDSHDRLHDRELKYKIIIHAERNAVLFAGRSVEECTLYTVPFMPCASCAGQMIQSGIAKVVSYENDNPRWQEDFALTQELFDEAGVELVLYKELP